MRTSRWITDDRGAITVIATFMSALIVGLVWYALGLGEAMIYREQMRAAADAVAFDAATIHALGMNMVSMINVTMAAVLAILLAVTVFLFICIGITLLSIACAALTLGACGGATADMLSFDVDVWNFCVDVRKVVFGPTVNIPGILPILDWTEGFVGVLMPWVAHGAVQPVAGDYPQAVVSAGIFSPSMVFTRVPILSNFLDQGINSLYKKLPFGLPALAKKVPAGSNSALKTASSALSGTLGESRLHITELQRYGLPIQNDKFSILCDHAGNELVQMLALIVGTVFGLQGESFVNSGFARSVGDIFGFVVGAAPGVFCTGADPVSMLTDGLKHIPLIGGWAARMAQGWIDSNFSDLTAGTPLPLFSATSGPDPFRDAKASWPKTIDKSITPMKVFDLAKNGNDWFAVYSTVKGEPALTTGALTGVQVATWAGQSRSPVETTDAVDGAQAEFYYDCGDTASNENDVGIGYVGPGGWATATDASPSWSTCKYSATWNMRWKARLRRVHPFEYNVGDSIGVLLYNLTGIEGTVQKALGAFEIGSGTSIKIAGLDKLKADFEHWVDAVLPNHGNVPLGQGDDRAFH
jgi:hypothetical protein